METSSIFDTFAILIYGSALVSIGYFIYSIEDSNLLVIDITENSPVTLILYFGFFKLTINKSVLNYDEKSTGKYFWLI